MSDTRTHDKAVNPHNSRSTNDNKGDKLMTEVATGRDLPLKWEVLA